MDARNLCEFVTSMNKYLENKSIKVPLQTTHHRFRKSPELKITEMQEYMAEVSYILVLFLLFPVAYFSIGLFCRHWTH